MIKYTTSVRLHKKTTITSVYIQGYLSSLYTEHTFLTRKSTWLTFTVSHSANLTIFQYNIPIPLLNQ